MTHAFTNRRTDGAGQHSCFTGAAGRLLLLLLAALVLWTAPAPAQPAEDPYWPVRGRHVFARDGGGNLIFYRENWLDPDVWEHENLSARFPAGHEIVGRPRPVATWHPTPRADVFARNSAGELIHYWWTEQDDWLAENLTVEEVVDGPLFTSTPVPVAVYNHPYLDHHVFGLNDVGELIYYWWSAEPPGNWHARNLTADLGGPIMLGEPVVVDVAVGGLHIFGRNSMGQLIHYWRDAPRSGDWHTQNLTADLGGPTMVSEPAVVVGSHDGYLHYDIFARNSADQLIHYWWYGGWRGPSPSGWYAENLTTLISGWHIRGNPIALVSHQNGYLRHDVFALHRRGELIHYWWSAAPPSGWHSENLTIHVGGPTIQTDLVAEHSRVGYLRHDVFGRNSAGQLIHYWWSAQSGWQTENRTTALSGPTFVSITLDAYIDPFRPLQVFARNSSNHLIHYGIYPNDWQAKNLTMTFGGPTIIGSPAVIKLPAPYEEDEW